MLAGFGQAPTAPPGQPPTFDELFAQAKQSLAPPAGPESSIFRPSATPGSTLETLEAATMAMGRSLVSKAPGAMQANWAVKEVARGPTSGLSKGGGDLARSMSQPTLAEITDAARKDPVVRQVLQEEWTKKRLADAYYTQAVNTNAAARGTPLTAEPSPEMEAAQLPPLDQLTWRTSSPAMRDSNEAIVAHRAAAEEVQQVLPPPTDERGVVERIMQRLSAIKAQPEIQFAKQHPILNATAEVAGETPRLAVEMGVGSLVGLPMGAPGTLARMIGAGVAFDAINQSQSVLAGGQPAWSPQQSALNILGMVGGGIAGRSAATSLLEKGASEQAAKTVAAAIANAGMLGVPTAAQAIENWSKEGHVDWGSFGISLYKGLLQTAALSGMPELQMAAHDINASPEERAAADQAMRRLASEQARQGVNGESWAKDVNDKLEQMVNEQGAPPPGQPPPPPPDVPPAVPPKEPPPEPNAVGPESPIPEVREHIQTAQDILLAAGQTADAKARTQRQIEALKKQPKLTTPEAEDAYNARYSTIAKLEKGIAKAAPGSAEQLKFSTEDGIRQLLAQEGAKEFPGLVNTLRNHAANLIGDSIQHLRAKEGPPPGRENESGRLRIGLSPQEKKEVEEHVNLLTEEKDRFISRIPEWIRQLVNAGTRKLAGVVGLNYQGNLIKPRDRALEQLMGGAAIERTHDQGELDRIRRKYTDLLNATDVPNNMARAIALAASVRDAHGASLVLDNLPQELREKAKEVVADFRAYADLAGHEGVKHGLYPEALWEIPEAIEDKNGDPLINPVNGEFVKKIVATKPGEAAPAGGELVGGRKFYEGMWVHHAYQRNAKQDWVAKQIELAGRGPGRLGEREGIYRFITQRAPSSTFGRELDQSAWMERGIVSLDPSFRQLRDQSNAIYAQKTLDYMATRPDIYRTNDNFNASGGLDALNAEVKAAIENKPELWKKINKQKNFMAKNGIPIYAGDHGPLTKELMRDRAAISERLETHVRKMGENGIPIEGDPAGFDRNAPGNKKRADQIDRAQRRYEQLSNQFWSHAFVERPEELFGVKTTMTPEQLRENAKLKDLYTQAMALERLSTATWTQLKGHQFFSHEGSWVRADVLRDLEMENEGLFNKLSLYDEFTRTYKAMRVRWNPIRTLLNQTLGNSIALPLGGAHATAAGFMHWIRAWKGIAGYLWSGNHPSDPWFEELVSSGKIMHAGLMFDTPTVEKEAIARSFETAEQLAKPIAEGGKDDFAGGMRNWLAGIARWARYFPSKIPGLGRVGWFCRICDLAPMYAMYRQLRSGEGSSFGAPLNRELALNHVSAFFDMSDVPRILNKAAATAVGKVFMPPFWRYYVKSAESFIKWNAMTPPTLGIHGFPGLPLPELFEKTITENAGSAKATAAVAANLMTNFALNIAKITGEWALLSHIATARLGINPDDPNYKRKLLAAADGNHFLAMLLQPIHGDTPGSIKFINPLNVITMLAPFSVGNAPDDLHTPSWMPRAMAWVFSMGWIPRMIQEGLTGKDFAGRDINPLQMGYNAIRSFLPGGFEMPLSGVLRAMDPNSTKSVGEALFQAVTGINIRTLKPGQEVTQYQRELSEGGHIHPVQDWQANDLEGKRGLEIINRSQYKQQQIQRAHAQRLLDGMKSK